jgi:pantoate--beta-alanine ligase
MSSRNRYLNGEDREAATVLYRSLLAGMACFHGHPPEGGVAVRLAMAQVLDSEPRARLDYADICHPDTFMPLEAADDLRPPALLAVAARVGAARLIDNFQLDSDGVWHTGAQIAAPDLHSQR